MNSFDKRRRFVHASRVASVIIEVVCKRHGVKRDVVCGQRRDHHAVRPRMIAMYTIRQATPLSFPEIGRLFQGRDHSTVIGAVRTVEAQLLVDPTLKTELITIAYLVAARTQPEFAAPQEEGQSPVTIEPEVTKQIAERPRSASLAVEAAVDGAEPPAHVVAARE